MFLSYSNVGFRGELSCVKTIKSVVVLEARKYLKAQALEIISLGRAATVVQNEPNSI